MKWVNALFSGQNRRMTMMSLLALGLGATAFGVTRKRIQGNMLQRSFMPLRRMMR